MTTQAILNTVLESALVDLRLPASRTLQAFNARNITKAAYKTRLSWVVLLGGAVAAIEPVTADGALTALDTSTIAAIDMGQFKIKHRFKISRIAIQEALSSNIPNELQNILSAQIMSGLRVIGDTINNLIYEGDGTAADGGIIGLNSINAATTYGGVATTDVPQWTTNKLTNATPRALSRDLLYRVDESVSLKGLSYDLILSSPTTARSYINLFDSLVGGANLNPNRVDVGQNVTRFYNGIPIIEDPRCPVGTMYFVNSSDLDLFGFVLSTGSLGYTPDVSIVSRSLQGLPVFISEVYTQNPIIREYEILTLPMIRYSTPSALTVLDQLS